MRRRLRLGTLVVLAGLGVAVFAVASRSHSSRPLRADAGMAAEWRGLVGSPRPPVGVAQRVLVASPRIEEKCPVDHSGLKTLHFELSEDDGDKDDSQLAGDAGGIRKLVVVFAPPRLGPLRVRFQTPPWVAGEQTFGDPDLFRPWQLGCNIPRWTAPAATVG